MTSIIEAYLRDEVPEWKDDVKMKDLFAPLPATRDLDPATWDRRLEFWKRVLPKVLHAANVISFSIEDLKPLFRRNGYFPTNLESVLAEMCRNGLVKGEEQVQASGDGVGSWLGGIVSWGWKQIAGGGESTEDSIDVRKRFVMPTVLEEKADQLLKSNNEKAVFVADQLSTKQQLLETSGLNSHDLDVLLKYMSSKGKAAVFETSRGEAVKIARLGESKVVVNEADKGILTLKETLASLEKQEAQLNQTIDGCKSKAAEWLKKKDRTRAKAELTRKKHLEAILTKRISFIDNIQQIMHTIEQTHTDKEIVEQYKLGVSTLKQVREGLTVDAVHDAVDDLKDALLDQQEIDDAIAAGNEQLNPTDEDELEQELAQLAAESEPTLSELIPQRQPTTAISAKPREAAAMSALADLPSVAHLPDPVVDGRSSSSATKAEEEEDLPDPDSLEFGTMTLGKRQAMLAE